MDGCQSIHPIQSMPNLTGAARETVHTNQCKPNCESDHENETTRGFSGMSPGMVGRRGQTPSSRGARQFNPHVANCRCGGSVIP